MLFLLLALCVFFEGCTTSTPVPTPRVDAAADAGIDVTDASVNMEFAEAGGGEVANDGGTASYDGPLDDAIPCPAEGFPHPCTSPPEVVYTCRCVEIHCVGGRMILTPHSGSPCP